MNPRVDYCYSKSFRLLKRGQFRRVQRASRKKVGKHCILHIHVHTKRSHEKAPSRLGITVSTKYGKAHLRNRFKRLIREVFRLHHHKLPPGLDLIARPNLPATSLCFEQMALDFCHLLNIPYEPS